jgi:hypothetical protein
LGRSFANLHVKVGPDGHERTLDRVTAAIQGWMSDRAYEPASGDDGDRAVLVGLDPGGGWVAVYDSEIDRYRGAELPGLGTALSMTGSPVVGCSVFDSDVAIGWLFLNGETVEWIVGRPEVMDDPMSSEADAPGGGEGWRAVLPPGIAPERFTTAWRDRGEDDVVADDRAASALELLGIDGRRATSGYRDALDSAEVTELRRLEFTGGPPPDATHPMRARTPAVIQATVEPSMNLAHGNRFALAVRVTNTGGTTRHVGILLAGEAVSSELVGFEGASIRRMPGSRLAGHDQLSEAPVTKVGDRWVAVLPAVLLGSATDQVPENDREATIVLIGRSLRAGRGQLEIRVGDASSDEDDGSAICLVDVRVAH